MQHEIKWQKKEWPHKEEQGPEFYFELKLTQEVYIELYKWQHWRRDWVLNIISDLEPQFKIKFDLKIKTVEEAKNLAVETTLNVLRRCNLSYKPLIAWQIKELQCHLK